MVAKVLITILIVLIVLVVVLYFVGKKMQAKQAHGSLTVKY